MYCTLRENKLGQNKNNELNQHWFKDIGISIGLEISEREKVVRKVEITRRNKKTDSVGRENKMEAIESL